MQRENSPGPAFVAAAEPTVSGTIPAQWAAHVPSRRSVSPRRAWPMATTTGLRRPFRPHGDGTPRVGEIPAMWRHTRPIFHPASLHHRAVLRE